MAFVLAIVIGFGAMLAPAMAAHKRGHRPHHPSFVQPAPRPVFDPTGGNAAAGGNNANSMSGSNSAGENANGRSSGGGFGGM
ncbi:hypothetical protein [Bradyrhizobium sp. WD16]|uniref:hypothetical protein n=1 Tax=Bradyrhizobium sp. WD16 TaxID=1521768 RepID=UPI0020A362A9|nr:hypothetical protein [Bradyrhizobium sp. WD16]